MLHQTQTYYSPSVSVVPPALTEPNYSNCRLIQFQVWEIVMGRVILGSSLCHCWCWAGLSSSAWFCLFLWLDSFVSLCSCTQRGHSARSRITSPSQSSQSLAVYAGCACLLVTTHWVTMEAQGCKHGECPRLPFLVVFYLSPSSLLSSLFQDVSPFK